MFPKKIEDGAMKSPPIRCDMGSKATGIKGSFTDDRTLLYAPSSLIQNIGETPT